MVDLTARIGSVTLPNPVMPAAGTAGYGTELHAYVDLSTLGAMVVKSLAPFPWDGNEPLRAHSTHAGMLNSVGLQGPGVERWLVEQLPELAATGARIVVSIWGHTIDDYRRAAELLADAPPSVVAIECNLSCPNTEAGGQLLAHDIEASAATVAATLVGRRPVWAKLSPNTDRIADIARATVDAGAEAVTLTNTLLGMAIDPRTGAYLLGSGARGGGYSGPAVHPVVVRIVHDIHRRHPEIPIVGVGGVSRGADALELLRAGASAVQVGTAHFADPRASRVVLDELDDLLTDMGVTALTDIIGVVG